VNMLRVTRLFLFSRTFLIMCTVLLRFAKGTGLGATVSDDEQVIKLSTKTKSFGFLRLCAPLQLSGVVFEKRFEVF